MTAKGLSRTYTCIHSPPVSPPFQVLKKSCVYLLLQVINSQSRSWTKSNEQTLGFGTTGWWIPYRICFFWVVLWFDVISTWGLGKNEDQPRITCYWVHCKHMTRKPFLTMLAHLSEDLGGRASVPQCQVWMALSLHRFYLMISLSWILWTRN